MWDNIKTYTSCIIFIITSALFLMLWFLLSWFPATSFEEILVLGILVILLLLYEFFANEIKYKLYVKKNARWKTKIINFMPPKGISPAIVWILCDWKANMHDITCLIYNWAANWIISIELSDTKQENKWKFNWRNIEDGNIYSNWRFVILKKLRDLPEDTPWYELSFFNSIFRWKYKVKNIYHSEQLALRDDIVWLEEYVIKKWWMSRKINIFLVCSFIFTIIMVFICFSYKRIYLLLFLCYIINYLRKKIWTPKLHLEPDGVKVFLEIYWYRKFIKNCDAKQINAYLKEDPLFINKTLPYAIAFWLKTEFLSKITPTYSRIKKVLKPNF